MGYQVVTKNHKAKIKRRNAKRLVMFVFLIIILAVCLVLYLYWHSMIPIIIDIAQTKVSSQTMFVVNNAVSQVLKENASYSSLVDIQRDSNNNVVLISANTLLVNNLARQLAIFSQSQLESLAKSVIEVPFGTISGLPLLAEKGPEIEITVNPIGNVTCEFTSTFQSVGINQTLHRIYINVNSKVDLIIPTAHSVVESTVPVLICESVIVGAVPDTYLQGGWTMNS